jgi:hypothetical protein
MLNLPRLCLAFIGLAGPLLAASGQTSSDLSGFADVKVPITSWITEPLGTSRDEVHQDIQLDKRAFQAAFSAHAIATFEIEKVTQP